MKAGQLIKSVADATDKLLDLQKKLKDVEEESQSKYSTNVTNALFCWFYSRSRQTFKAE